MDGEESDGHLIKAVKLKPIYHKPANRNIAPKLYSIGQVISIPVWGMVGSVLDAYYSWLHRNWLYCIKYNDDEIWVGQGAGVNLLLDVSPIFFIGTLDN